MGFTDWNDLGIFPLQDHEEDVPLAQRQTIVGGRVVHLGDPTDSDQARDSVLEYGADNEMGTLGDIHPWLFWQTKDRGERGMGAWSMAWSGMAVGGGDGGFKGGHTGRPVNPAVVLPWQTMQPGDQVQETPDPRVDERLANKVPGWPKCFPSIPQGTTVMVMPGTEEGSQQEIVMHADPRMVAVNVEGPAEAGSLVVDLQPEAQICTNGAKEPGVKGRDARLQSMMRVVAMPEQGLGALNCGRGNSLAWQLAKSGVDKLAGYGLCFAELDGSAGTSGPITQSGRIGGSVSDPYMGLMGVNNPAGGSNYTPGTIGGNGAKDAVSGKAPRTPSDTGEFSPKPKGGHGLFFMAHSGAYGPISAGHVSDKHNIGQDRDGHPINSGHIATGAYFYSDVRKDGPLLFEPQDYPKDVNKNFPLKSEVHLVWDDSLNHPHLTGSKSGYWRWYAEVPYYKPDTRYGIPPTGIPPGGGGPPTGGPGRRPTVTPGRPGGNRGSKGPTTHPRGKQPGGPPITGGPGTTTKGGYTGPITGGRGSGSGSRGTGGGPITGGRHRLSTGGWMQGPNYEGDPGVGRSGKGSGDKTLATSIDLVGEVAETSQSLFLVHHPMMESFAELAFRPQLMVEGEPSFIHNPDSFSDEIVRDEAIRPQVLACRAWGAADAAGQYTYVKDPTESRARGGTSHGGILFTPPHLEMEDYFGINSQANVSTVSTVSYVTVAPYVGFALGTPGTDGGLNVKSVVIAQEPTDTNQKLVIKQINSAGNQIELFHGQVSQTTGGGSSTGEVVVGVGTGSNQAVLIPRGTAAQRPSTISPDANANGAALRMVTDQGSTEDVLEYYDQQTDTWKQLVAADADDPDIMLTNGSQAMTGGLTINSSDGITVVGAAPQLKISDSSTDEATKKGFFVLAHDDNDEEDFCIIYARSQDLVGKISIGGGDSSVNAASAVSIYVAANGDTVTGTELIRVKTTGMRIGGSGNPTATCILDLGSVNDKTFLPPKGTTSQRDAISQETGSIYYNTTTNKLQCHNGTGWQDCF